MFIIVIGGGKMKGKWQIKNPLTKALSSRERRSSRVHPQCYLYKELPGDHLHSVVEIRCCFCSTVGETWKS